jgi:hypothetical protein
MSSSRVTLRPGRSGFKPTSTACSAQIESDLRTPTLAKADLPTDGTKTLAVVSDEAGGTVLAFFDGAAWRPCNRPRSSSPEGQAMPSTPTPRNRLNLQGQGDNPNSWGTVLNAQVFALLDEALDGVTTLTITANVSLSSANYAHGPVPAPGSEAHRVANRFVYHHHPQRREVLLRSQHNSIRPHGHTAGGTGVTVAANTLTFVYCDGTNTFSPPAGLTAEVGTIVDFAGAVAPTGWLLCFGQAVSRTTTPACSRSIGTAWGAGNGSSTFNLPDFRGRFRVGLDTMGGVAANRLANHHRCNAGRLGRQPSLPSTHPWELGGGGDHGQPRLDERERVNATVSYFDWTTPVTSVGVTSGGTPILAPATFGGDISRTVLAQPVSVTLSGTPAASHHRHHDQCKRWNGHLPRTSRPVPWPIPSSTLASDNAADRSQLQSRNYQGRHPFGGRGGWVRRG